MVLQYTGCYSLDLYCDRLKNSPNDFEFQDGVHPYGVFPQQFTGETFAECAKQAKFLGWKIHRATRTATCPKCARMK